MKKLRSYRGEIQTTGKKYSYEDKAAAVEKLLPEDVVATGVAHVPERDDLARGQVDAGRIAPVASGEEVGAGAG